VIESDHETSLPYTEPSASATEDTFDIDTYLPSDDVFWNADLYDSVLASMISSVACEVHLEEFVNVSHFVFFILLGRAGVMLQRAAFYLDDLLEELIDSEIRKILAALFACLLSTLCF
jgi:hypothetical protein